MRYRFDVFGRDVMVVREDADWVVYDLGGDGKRRLANDIRVPSELSADDLAQYLDDLCHERATPRHSRVRPLD